MRNQKYSIFLIKDNINRVDNIIKNHRSLKQFKINISGLSSAVLFVKKLPSKTPRWLSLFEEVISAVDISALKSTTISGVLLAKRTGRYYAITFGYGRSLLEPGCYEERFGLIVTLNSIDPDSIRSIDKKTFDSPIYKHTRDQASRKGSASDFGLNFEQDLVRSMTGSPLQDALGHKLSGADSLAVTIKANLVDLPNMLDNFYIKFKDTSYKEIFPWADHFSEVTDKSKVADLNQALLDKIKENNFERLWMSVPEIIDWSDISGFRYTSSSRGDALNDLDIISLLSQINLEDINIDILKRKKVYAFNIDDSAPYRTWSAYKCIYCEIDSDGNTYLLNSGSWYCIATTFVDEINSQLSEMPSANINLPICANLSEGEYNEKVYRDSQGLIALMDKKNIIHGGGRSKIEFCDLYTRDKKIIHVKKYGASSVLSHLVNQGLISGHLFNIDPDFREKVNQKLPSTFKLVHPRNQIQPADYEIIYAVISKESGEHVTLPFFSRVSLVLAARQLRGYGYKVSLKKIHVAQ